MFPDAADHHEDFLSVKEEILAVVEKINEDACNDCVVTGLREATLEFACGMSLESRRLFAEAMKKDLQELALPDRNERLAADLYAYVQYRTERLGHVYTGADEQWFLERLIYGKKRFPFGIQVKDESITDVKHHELLAEWKRSIAN